MTLSIRFWGTRGSIPAPGASTVRYGGNTPCIEVRAPGGALVILDAGTGIRELGRALLDDRAGDAPITGDIFLTHAHWDHIQGLPFFAPFFHAGNCFRIWSASDTTARVDRIVRDQMSPAVFPVPFADLEATVEFRELNDAQVGAGYAIDAFPVRHPGGALGYRVRAAGAARTALVYIPDNELAPTPEHAVGAGWRDRLVEFAHGASVLVHDTTYTAAEYQDHRGWGHSRYGDALELALDAGVERLALFHHNPERSDDALDHELAACRAAAVRRGSRLEVIAAAEGMTLEV